MENTGYSLLGLSWHLIHMLNLSGLGVLIAMLTFLFQCRKQSYKSSSLGLEIRGGIFDYKEFWQHKSYRSS